MFKDAPQGETQYEEPKVDKLQFTDDRIDDIRSGRSPMTTEERAYLIEDTPRFEECSDTAEDLAKLSDPDLMSAAYRVWADYCSCMY